jgi:hypothetical protein
MEVLHLVDWWRMEWSCGICQFLTLETIKLTFQVNVLGGTEIINDRYAVSCDEGVFAYGEPVVTNVKYLVHRIALPITQKN